MTHLDLLRSVRDRCRDALLDALEPSGALGPGAETLASLHPVPEALAACGALAAARRVLDRCVRALDDRPDAPTEALASLALAAARTGRGDVLLRVRNTPGDDGDDPIAALLLGARLALGAGDIDGVRDTLDLCVARGADALLDGGHEGDALAFACDARALLDDPQPADALADRLYAHALERPTEDPARLAARARAFAALHRARSAAREADALRPLDHLARAARALAALQRDDGRVGASDWAPVTARVLLATHEALAALDAPDARPAAAGWRVVLCNAPPADAPRIADAVIAERLAACVNIVASVQSVYAWKGAVEHETESTMILKTTAERVAALTARLRALHPYELPEVISLPLAGDEGHGAYLAWVAAQVSPR